MARASLFIATLLLAAGLLGCGRQTASSQQIVILIDVSDSIESAAEQEAFVAVDRLVAQLQRGDKIAIIPITGDAQAETSGRVIRFDVPTERQAYDNDLRQFRNKLKTALTELEAKAMANPGEHTDILGTVVLAQQESKFNARASRRSLVILSDFIQDDAELSFLKDRRLANKTAAREFAMQSAKNSQLDFRGAPIYLGLLRSKDYRNLVRSRREAIQEFWIDYFNSCGGQTVFATDGTGLLGNFAEGQIDRRK
jgi:hypothetical protein